MFSISLNILLANAGLKSLWILFCISQSTLGQFWSHSLSPFRDCSAICSNRSPVSSMNAVLALSMKASAFISSSRRWPAAVTNLCVMICEKESWSLSQIRTWNRTGYKDPDRML